MAKKARVPVNKERNKYLRDIIENDEGFRIVESPESGAEWLFATDLYEVEFYNEPSLTSRYLFVRSNKLVKTEEGFYTREPIGIRLDILYLLIDFIETYEKWSLEEEVTPKGE